MTGTYGYPVSDHAALPTFVRYAVTRVRPCTERTEKLFAVTDTSARANMYVGTLREAQDHCRNLNQAYLAGFQHGQDVGQEFSRFEQSVTPRPAQKTDEKLERYKQPGVMYRGHWFCSHTPGYDMILSRDYQLVDLAIERKDDVQKRSPL